VADYSQVNYSMYRIIAAVSATRTPRDLLQRCNLDWIQEQTRRLEILR